MLPHFSLEGESQRNKQYPDYFKLSSSMLESKYVSDWQIQGAIKILKSFKSKFLKWSNFEKFCADILLGSNDILNGCL